MKARGRLLRRILRALLALYPVRFRRELGRDVADTHVDRYRGERRRGRAAAVAYSAIALADVCWGAVLEWQEGPWFEIVGVAADTRDMGLDLPAPPAVYLPFAQKPDAGCRGRAW